ncbi:MAG: long-chain fatty acid--CoA ligase [Chloroflexi bacterium]|nr:long-chain fatty acid--CoA ligase [Chloroflexota bacterium]OJW01856.1 MAG: long-chain-fatty-acid--CoA ligase [Chloroflexi bacterium 54-19]
MSLNFASLLTESAKSNPERTAIIFDSFKLTYSQLNAVTNQFANGLDRLGIKRGDHVAIMMPNIPQFLIAYYGIAKLGAVIVPINVLFKAGEIDYVLNDSEALALVAWEGFMEEAAKGYRLAPLCHHLIIAQAPGSTNPLPAVDGVIKFEEVYKTCSPFYELAPTQGDDTAVIMYTSGTTGRPKGAELTNLNCYFSAIASEKLMPVSPNDVGLGALPFFHIYGQSSVMNSMLERIGAITLIPRFDPAKVFEVIERDRVTIMCGVPTMFFALLHYPDRKKFDTSSLKYAVSGGSALPVELLHAFEAEFKIPLLEGYGLSEDCASATFNMVQKPRKAGSVGLADWGTEVKVFDEKDREVGANERGEIVLRGPNVMKGYYNRPEATAEVMRDEWFHTGDIGYKDEEGYIYIVDRIKDLIIRGGYNVYPREVEDVFYQHPAIREAAVIGVPDPKFGEEIKAYVSLKPGYEATPAELIEYLQERVANYKYPRMLDILPDLPKNATGKILKTNLRGLNNTSKPVGETIKSS